jgi:hypothetical protein
MEARHLKRMLASLVDCSGYFDASSASLCAMVYDKTGLESDILIGIVNRIYTKAQGLARHWPDAEEYVAH